MREVAKVSKPEDESDPPLKACPRCGAEILTPDARFCMKCRLDFSTVTTSAPSEEESPQPRWEYCPNCGTEILVPDGRYCTKCGLDLQTLRARGEVDWKRPPRPIRGPESFPYDYFRPPPRPRKWGVIISLLMPVVAMIVEGLVGAGVLILYMFGSGPASSTNDLMILLSLGFKFLYVLLPVLYVGRNLRDSTLSGRLKVLGVPLKKEGRTRKDLYKDILIGVGFAGVMVGAVMGIQLLFQYLAALAFGVDFVEQAGAEQSSSTSFLSTNDPVTLVILVLSMLFIVGPTEEILFRGFTQQGIESRWGKNLGIFVTAVMFALAHVLPFVLVSLPVFVVFLGPYLVISLLLGILMYWRKNNILPNIIAHGVYNSILIVLEFILYAS